MNLQNLISELKRRNVFRVATAYAIAGWLIIQVVTSISEPLELPSWFSPAVIILVAIGLPIALIFAWAFELTPEGLKKSNEVEITESVTRATGKKINGIIITVLSVAVVFLLVERIFFAQSTITEDSTLVVPVSDKSIAVLPFDDFNAGGNQEYFADGLTEEILNSLAKTPDLLVASRTSSFQYKKRNIDIVKIADTLGVAHILEGSVRESADKYRITAQLIRASDGFHLWSENYDRPKTDIIDIQEDIAFKIATALETAMDPEALRDMVNVGTSSIEAYEMYVEGNSILYRTDFINNSAEALQLYEAATEADPDFADAHYQIAALLFNDLSLTSMGSEIFDYPYDEKLRMLDERLSKAIQNASEIDRDRYLSTQALINLEIRKSTDYLIRYLSNRPTGVLNYSNLVYQLSSVGDFDLANEYTRQAQDVMLNNEFDASSIISFYFWAQNWDEADPWMQEQLDKYPYNEVLAYQAHRIMMWRGEYDRGREILKRLKGLEIPIENFDIADLRQACADNDVELANQIYEEKVSDSRIGTKWISLKILGRDQEAHELIKPLDDNNRLVNLIAWLYYPYFDYTKYPNLVAALRSENMQRAQVSEIPFRCGR